MCGPETGQTGDWSGQRLSQGGCDFRAVYHLRPRSRTLWGVSGHRFPGRPFSFALRAICDMKNPGRAGACPRVQRTPCSGTGREIGAFYLRLAGASLIPMPGSHFLFRAIPTPSKSGLEAATGRSDDCGRTWVAQRRQIGACTATCGGAVASAGKGNGSDRRLVRPDTQSGRLRLWGSLSSPAQLAQPVRGGYPGTASQRWPVIVV
jgi:hypothetical protein